MSSEGVSALIKKAQSRAAMIASLDNAFENRHENRKRARNEVEAFTQTHSDRDLFIDRLYNLLRETGGYTRQKVEDQIKGKTIVLQHLRSGGKTALGKMRKAHKSIRKAPHADIKAKDHFNLNTISPEELRVLRAMFSSYMSQFCCGCKSLGQFQARLLGCEVTGSPACLVESKDTGMQKCLGEEGIIIGESANCFDIAFESKFFNKKKQRKRRRKKIKLASDENSSDLKRNSEQMSEDYVIKRVYKAESRLALRIENNLLPNSLKARSANGDESDLLIIVLHGKKFLPHIDASFNSMPSL